MIGIASLFYAIGTAYLGYELFPWWTPFVTGIVGTILAILPPHRREPILHALYSDPTTPTDIALPLALWRMLRSRQALSGLMPYVATMYLMSVFLAFVLFGIGWAINRFL
jgi:hypothetical protein